MQSKNIVLALVMLTVLVLVGWWWISTPAIDNSQSTPATAVKSNQDLTNTTVTDKVSPKSASDSSSNPSTAITKQEVATHSSTDDCWIIVEGQVYDLSGFNELHPGGSQPIASSCGSDATTLFQTRSGKGPHPATARATLEQKLVGPLVE